MRKLVFLPQKPENLTLKLNSELRFHCFFYESVHMNDVDVNK